MEIVSTESLFDYLINGPDKNEQPEWHELILSEDNSHLYRGAGDKMQDITSWVDKWFGSLVLTRANKYNYKEV